MGQEIGELFSDVFNMAGAGYDRRSGGRSEGKKTVPSGLDERPSLQREIEKELRVVFSRQRPEAGTCATSWDHDIEAGNVTVRMRVYYE